MHACGPVIPLALALACATSAGPGDPKANDSSDTAVDVDTSAVDVETSAGFVPDDESTETGLSPVDSHDEDIQPYWTYNCVIYCHDGNPDTEAGVLDLDFDAAYDAMVDVQATQVDMLLVAPGSPENSYLWHKLRGTHLDVGGSGDQMPRFTLPLDAETMVRIETWIMIGAPP